MSGTVKKLQVTGQEYKTLVQWLKKTNCNRKLCYIYTLLMTNVYTQILSILFNMHNTYLYITGQNT
jgi:hypothetical protein